MGRKLDTTYRYRLTVAPSMDHLKKGLHMTHSFTDRDIAWRLYRDFVAKGLVCIMTTITVSESRVDCSNEDVARFWGMTE